MEDSLADEFVLDTISGVSVSTLISMPTHTPNQDTLAKEIKILCKNNKIRVTFHKIKRYYLIWGMNPIACIAYLYVISLNRQV
jgi:hypothetical protein